MGRACVIYLCFLLLTLTPAAMGYGWAEAPPDRWEDFIAQYRLLEADGKYALAERLWNNNYDEMEQYAQTLPPQYEETWRQLMEEVSSIDDREGYQMESLLTFLEAASSKEPQQTVNLKIQKLSSMVTDSSVSHGTLQEEWHTVRPVVGLYKNEEQLISVDQSFVKLLEMDTMEVREDLSQRIGGLLTTSDETEVAALFSTAMSIGGAIILTLIYVATRKYQGRSKNRHKMPSGHS